MQKIRITLLVSLAILVIAACKKDPPLPLPTADFFVENNGCTAPCSLYFYDNSVNAVGYSWEFGNGVKSSDENPRILYPEPGTYAVWLWATNGDGARDSIQKSVSIN